MNKTELLKHRVEKLKDAFVRADAACKRRMTTIKGLQKDMRKVAKWIEKPCRAPAPAWIVVWLAERATATVAELYKEYENDNQREQYLRSLGRVGTRQ